MERHEAGKKHTAAEPEYNPTTLPRLHDRPTSPRCFHKYPTPFPKAVWSQCRIRRTNGDSLPTPGALVAGKNSKCSPLSQSQNDWSYHNLHTLEFKAPGKRLAQRSFARPLKHDFNSLVLFWQPRFESFLQKYLAAEKYPFSHLLQLQIHTRRSSGS